MANIPNICEGAFLGHIVASNLDPSILLAENIGASLLACKRFDGSDILSRHLFLYHDTKAEIGATTKHMYQHAMNTISSSRHPTVTSAQSFLFSQNKIDEMVQLTDKELDGHTAGCGPSQRSFPLALYCGIDDDDLFDLTVGEAKLTHWHPMAGQVAGVVNLIIRALLRGKSFDDAISSAFLAPGLSADLLNVGRCYHRWPTMSGTVQAGLSPAVLGASLFYLTNTRDAVAAIKLSQAKDKHYCAPLVGILAGARWGIVADVFERKVSEADVRRIRALASQLSSQWKIKTDSVVA